MSNTANWIGLLPENVQHEIKEKFKIKKFKDGEYVYRRGDVGNSQYQILSGSVRLRVIADNGKEATYVIYTSGDCIGFLSAIDHQERPQDVVAIGEVTIGKLLYSDFELLSEKHPSINKALCSHVSSRVRELFSMYENGMFFKLERRLASQILFLLEFSGSVSTCNGYQELDLTQEMLASSVCATRQAVNKVLKDWSDADIIEYHYGTISIKDFEKLQDISQVGDV